MNECQTGNAQCEKFPEQSGAHGLAEKTITQTGQLSFDSNGRAVGGVTAVAVFTGRPALSASDIQIVSAMT